jgi:hypothetical protein
MSLGRVLALHNAHTLKSFELDELALYKPQAQQFSIMTYLSDEILLEILSHHCSRLFQEPATMVR